ncbi:transposon I factor [Paraphaeosphaeria sporulosa]
MERIDPFCIPPWQQGIEAQILEGEEAQKWAEDSDELKVFVDASYRGHNAGVGVYHSVRRSDNSVVEHREAVKIGKNAGYTSTHVELTAIQAALELISAIWSPDTIARFGNKARDLTYVIIKLENPVDIDTALPGKHTKSIYNLQTYKRAAVLCQLRTGKCRLNSYLAKIGATNSERCTCRRRQPETVRHLVFECPLWKEKRKTLQEVAGNRWGDLSFFLGGRSEQRLSSGELLDGKAESWKPNLDVVNQTIEFAMATGRLC